MTLAISLPEELAAVRARSNTVVDAGLEEALEFRRDMAHEAALICSAWPAMTGRQIHEVRSLLREVRRLRSRLVGSPLRGIAPAFKVLRRPRAFIAAVSGLEAVIDGISPLFAQEEHDGRTAAKAMLAQNPGLLDRLDRARARARAGHVVEWKPSEEVRRSPSAS